MLEVSLVVPFTLVDFDISAVVIVGLTLAVELFDCDPLEEAPVEDELPLVGTPTAVCPKVSVGVAVLTKVIEEPELLPLAPPAPAEPEDVGLIGRRKYSEWLPVSRLYSVPSILFVSPPVKGMRWVPTV